MWTLRLAAPHILALALLLCLSASSRAAPPRPDIVLISIDTVRADTLTFRDARTAPHMSALAERGTVFDEAVSGTSWTLPAHAQMFTGMAPPYHGTESDDAMLDPLLPTLPELLKQAGYFTAGVFTVRYLWADYGLGRGFDFYSSAMLAENVDQEDEVRWAPQGKAAVERMRRMERRDYITSPNVLPLARRALERASPDEPLFLFVHFFDPHDDYIPPPPFDTRFDPNYQGSMDGRGYMTDRRVYDRDRDPQRRIGDRDLEHIRALYRGEIAWTDRWVGELLDLLATHRRLDDALIIITSDHGEEFFEHGLPGHRKGLFDEVVRVPLLVVPPASLRTGLIPSVAAQASLSDLLPTVLDFADLEVPGSVVGQSLRPAMIGEPFVPKPALLSLYISGQEPDGQKVHIQSYGIRTPDYKFLRTTVMLPGQPERVVPAYYDLESDPKEGAPIAALDDPRVQRAWHALEARLDDAREHWKSFPRSSRRERTAVLPYDMTAQELKALGYVEDVEPSALFEGLKPWGFQPLDPIEIPGGRDWPRDLLIASIALGVAALAIFGIRSRKK